MGIKTYVINDKGILISTLRFSFAILLVVGHFYLNEL